MNPIEKIRSELGLSQTQFAEKIGVSRATVWMWETNRTQPSALALFAIGERLGLHKSKRPEADFLQMGIREARDRLGLSFGSLANLLGCTKWECVAWEAKSKPIPLHYQKFIKYLLRLKEEKKLVDLMR